jgi:3-hydroxybutyrate dehydrogenase
MEAANGEEMAGLEKKRVLVTGANRGIGFAVAKGFAEAGARLTILSEAAAIHEAAEAIERETGARVDALQCDISERAAVAQAIAPLGRLDILINNAGIQPITPIRAPGEEVEATFRRVFEINVLGTYYVTREAVKRMEAGGRIVFTASVWSKSAAANYSAYVASKHAVLGFMRTLAKELGPEGIAVNAVCPGWVRTEGAMEPVREDARFQGCSEQDLIDEAVNLQAMGGLMEPEDIASAFLFLASDAAKNITGQTLHVDRGEFMD